MDKHTDCQKHIYAHDTSRWVRVLKRVLITLQNFRVPRLSLPVMSWPTDHHPTILLLLLPVPNPRFQADVTSRRGSVSVWSGGPVSAN
ncbi:hypothetical protein PoB_007207500 [Plakobranchus ocellatus]|uniref:Uncharacterized protein n=1 Tax=Plakobranchus ocellatus TaxID=259542 RepID=A0AAV4DNG0_9GAST|nr:hypothetical protein PoB_007207500 [Plakobranchus ocellatus]